MMDALANRRTYKVIGDPNSPAPTFSQDKNILDEILSAAGNAPFHCACDRIHQRIQKSPVPWRVYSLDAVQCRNLMKSLVDNGDATKVPAMLAVADYLVQVTWLPDPEINHEETTGIPDVVFSGTLRNMEHLAAAAAFAQSLLLGAENRGFKTYWSSGGALRKQQVFDWLGIPESQILVGSLFFFPGKTGNVEIKPGAMANKRGNLADWSRQVSIA